MQNLTENLNIGKNVFFYGETVNPYRYIPNADLLLFPSVHEAAGLIIEEAASLGVPVLATKTISSDEMVLENNFGWVSENSQEKFSKLLEFLLINFAEITAKKEIINNKNFNNNLNLKQFKNLLESQ